MDVSAKSFDDILADEFYRNEIKPWKPALVRSGFVIDETQWIYRLADEEEFIQSYFELEDLIFELKNAYFQSERTHSN